MRVLVKAESVEGGSLTLGSTDTMEMQLSAAKRTTMQIAEGIMWEGKISQQVELGLCRELVGFLAMCRIEQQFCTASTNYCGALFELAQAYN
jgi:hypothetical protein